MYKWILGFIGLYIFRLPGFFIGLFIGHQIDKNNFVKIRNNISTIYQLVLKYVGNKLTENLIFEKKTKRKIFNN